MIPVLPEQSVVVVNYFYKINSVRFFRQNKENFEEALITGDYSFRKAYRLGLDAGKSALLFENVIGR